MKHVILTAVFIFLLNVPVFGIGNPPVNLYIEISGPQNIYRLDASDLLTADPNLALVDTSVLQMFSKDGEIPILVEDGGDSLLDGIDYILFYGKPLKTAYTDKNVYRLKEGSGPGLRMSSVSYTPAGGTPVSTFRKTFVFEQDNLYDLKLPSDPEGDHYYYTSLYQADPDVTYDLSLGPGVSLSSGDTGYVTVYIQGKSSFTDNPSDHHVEVYLDLADYLNDITFDGQAAVSPQFSFTQNRLLASDTKVTVVAPQDAGSAFDNVLIDMIELDVVYNTVAYNNMLVCDLTDPGLYTITGFSSDNINVYDVTGGTPQLVSGLTPALGAVSFEISNTCIILAVEDTGLGSPDSIESLPPEDLSAGGSDYIIISDPSMTAQAEDFALIHPDLTVRIVDVRNVYDEFGGGIIEPDPIRDFILYAYQNYVPSPGYIALAGDFSYNRTGYVTSKFVYDDNHGVVTGDNWFVCVSGGDTTPEMAIGRIPATDGAELAAYITKLDHYMNTAVSGAWQEKTLFIADDADGIVEDEVFPFYNTILSQYIPEGYVVQFENLVDYAVPVDMQTEITTALDTGVLVTEYMGHGGIFNWTDFGELIFTNTEADLLSVADHRYTFVISLTCLDGYYTNPFLRSLSESLLFNPAGGAIGVFSSSGFATADDKLPLGSDMYSNLFQKDIRRIGDALLAAKQNFIPDDPSEKDLVLNTHNIMGDPALTLRIPSPLRPTALTGKASESKVTLTWVNSDTDSAAFNIYRRRSGSFDYTLIGSVIAPEVIFVDTDISDGKNYEYTVTAVTSGGLSSGYADSVKVSTPENTRGLLSGCSKSGQSGNPDIFVLIFAGSALLLIVTRFFGKKTE